MCHDGILSEQAIIKGKKCALRQVEPPGNDAGGRASLTDPYNIMLFFGKSTGENAFRRNTRKAGMFSSRRPAFCQRKGRRIFDTDFTSFGFSILQQDGILCNVNSKKTSKKFRRHPEDGRNAGQLKKEILQYEKASFADAGSCLRRVPAGWLPEVQRPARRLRFRLCPSARRIL